jgi:enoyl-CoA hydratase/carnithine racemase
MKLNGSLTCLDLRGNHLDDECGVALSGYLARRTKLATLLVSDNALLPAAAKALAKSWAENSVLTALDVRGNQLDADALKALKAARVAAAKKHAGAVELLVDEVEG